MNSAGYTLNKSQSPWANFKVTSNSSQANYSLGNTFASMPLFEILLRSRDTFEGCLQATFIAPHVNETKLGKGYCWELRHERFRRVCVKQKRICTFMYKKKAYIGRAEEGEEGTTVSILHEY